MPRPVNDTSGKPRDDDAPDYRDDALSELMTGAYAATSMVQMSVPEELPELPDWEPSEDAPAAEVLDETAGGPTKLTSGQHSVIDEPIDIDTDDDVPIDTDDLDERPPSPTVDVVPMLELGLPNVDAPDSGEVDPAALELGGRSRTSSAPSGRSESSLASPKSTSFTAPEASSTIALASLMSRWRTPWRWAAASPRARSSPYSAALRHGSGSVNSCSARPRMYSATMNVRLPS